VQKTRHRDPSPPTGGSGQAPTAPNQTAGPLCLSDNDLQDADNFFAHLDNFNNKSLVSAAFSKQISLY
jgi:hypothetical protein